MGRTGSRPGNLPAELTSFVGRRRELAELKRLAGTSRLLTLTGAGGAGKTRLALRAAAELARSLPDGAWFCSPRLFPCRWHRNRHRDADAERLARKLIADRHRATQTGSSSECQRSGKQRTVWA